MNFPHQDLVWTAANSGEDATTKAADHRALLAHAIARQASSQSARHYVAARNGLPSLFTATRTSFMNNRMDYFAGRIRSDMAGRRDARLFGSGCFRPDLAARGLNDMNG